MIKNDSKIYLLSDSEFRAIVNESESKAEILRKIGYKNWRAMHTHNVLNRRLNELSISKIFLGKKKSNGLGFNTQYTNEYIFCENSKYLSVHQMKKRLISENLIPYKCSICGNEGY